MNERELFIYYAKSNGIDPAVLGHKIKSPHGSFVIVGQRSHNERPVIVKVYNQRKAMPVHTLRKYMMRDKKARKFLDMQNEVVNSNLWFDRRP